MSRLALLSAEHLEESGDKNPTHAREDDLMPGEKFKTRRGFLAEAAAAVSVPLVVRSSALGAFGATAPSERITLGVIGVGWRGYYHIQHMVDFPEVQVLAVCDVVKSRREAGKRCVEENYSQREDPKGRYKGVASCNDFREIVGRDDVDAVMIATPDHWHAIPAIEAAKAGKDIYGEKPLARTVREARAMVNAVRRYGRVFQTGSQQRSSWGCRFACEIARSGRIGDLQKVVLSVPGPSGDCYAAADPIPEGTDHEMWLGPAPWHPYHGGMNFYEHIDLAGGGMTNMGAHYFDIVQWGLGADDTGPVEIIPPDGKDYPYLTYKYANGIPVINGGFEPSWDAGIRFHGAKGWVEANHHGVMDASPKSLLREPTRPSEVHLYNSPDPHPGKNRFGAQYEGYTVRHYTDWIRSMRTRQRPVADVEIGCRSLTVCLLGNIAYWLKRPLKWDPVKEEFLGDPEANRLLDRPMRPPWTL